MGVSELSKVSVILPRSDLPEALRELTDFGMFHAAQPDSHTYDDLLDDFSSRSFKIYITLRDLVRDLGLQFKPGIIDILRNGYNVPTEKIYANDWKDFVEGLEKDSQPIIDQLKAMGEKSESLEESVSHDKSMASALEMISDTSIDFQAFSNLKRLKIVIVIVQTNDLDEIKRSLPFALTESSELTSSESIIMVAAHSNDSELLDKVLRSFDAEVFSIPSDLPQNPSDAFKVVAERLSEREKELESSMNALKEIVSQNESKILALYEASNAAYESLESVKRTGDLRWFAVINGFIPTDMNDEFEKRFRDWISTIEPVNRFGHHHGGELVAPTLIKNTSPVSSFEGVTMNQGSPSYGEADPTPLISLVFPLFYGMMFGDLGHGIILLLFGILLMYRKAPGLVEWGRLFFLAGISASFFGLLIGEVFGLEIYNIFPAFGHPVIHFVERVHEIPSINAASLKFLLKISIIFGIFHIYAGNFIGILNDVRNHEYTEIIIERVPVVSMYTGFILLMFAFLGTSFQISELFTSMRDTPIFFFWRAVPVATTATVGITLLLGGLVVLVAGKPILIVTGRIPKESVIMAILVGVIDGAIEKIAGFLSNTLSYTRLAILLTVHASLLIVVNLLWGLPLLVALPVVIFFNILVILLEGMIVYIQVLRLHLYEWFTKFYSGSGMAFKSLTPKMIRAQIEWKERAIS